MCIRDRWQGLNEQRAGWWIEPDTLGLGATLRSAMQLADAKREEMGRRGHAWIRSEFAWSEIADRMEGVYRWLPRADRSEVPDGVHLT